MKKGKLAVLAAALGASLALTSCGSAEVTEKTIEKSEYSNPIVQFREDDGTIIYGGDPSVLVDGDTVYLYTGHDMSSDKQVEEKTYNIPEYFCYSTKDLKTWKQEGVVMNMKDVAWTRDNTAAWAAQVMKHKDPESGTDKYYLYYCSWDKKAAGKQSIGVAVADSPTGPFVDIGEPLVRGFVTKPQTSNWNDIDPTAWIETDEDGTEHRYLAWGNGLFYICELNPDMISVTDQNGDGKITCTVSGYSDGDIVNRTMGLNAYTEAPWIYRHSDGNGGYTGPYYLFYATGWREGMGYSTTDDLITGDWKDGGCFMQPNATSNTNHEAVFDFQGHTYFIYHDGAQPGGNGYRRSACIREITFNEDGTVVPMEETAAGLFGTKSTIALKDGSALSHEGFTNSSDDKDYPYTDVIVGTGLSDAPQDGQWVITAGHSDSSIESQVSIQSENKAGLYLTVSSDGDAVHLAQDTDAKPETAAAQTFITKTGLNGDKEGTSFESISRPGFYLTVVDGMLTVSDKPAAKDATFYITTVE